MAVVGGVLGLVGLTQVVHNSKVSLTHQNKRRYTAARAAGKH